MGEGGVDGADRQLMRADAVVPIASGPSADVLASEVAAARAYRGKAKAANTLRAYASDWNQFEGWCDERGLEALPARPEAVATWLAALAVAGKADSTIARHLAAIGWRHRQAGLVPPTSRDERMVVADTLAGIRREAHIRPSRAKGPARSATVRCWRWGSLRRCGVRNWSASRSATLHLKRRGSG